MKTLTLRLDEKLHTALVKVATDDGRSINGAIVQAIKKYVEENK